MCHIFGSFDPLSIAGITLMNPKLHIKCREKKNRRDYFGFLKGGFDQAGSSASFGSVPNLEQVFAYSQRSDSEPGELVAE